MEKDLGFELVDNGDKVKHPTFGNGTVTSRIGDGLSAKVVVKFQAPVGEKKLALRYAKLKKIVERTALAPAEGDAEAAPAEEPAADKKK